MKSLKEDFSLMSSLLIPVAVAINFTGFGIAKFLQLPIFLDSIGSVFISLIAGPWVGTVTAVITSLITGSFSPEYFAFIPVAICNALVVGVLAKMRTKNLVIKTIIVSLALASASIIVSIPIIIKVYGGFTGNASSTVVVLFKSIGFSLEQAVAIATMLTEAADKIVTTVISILIIKSMSDRYLIKFKYGENYIYNKNGE